MVFILYVLQICHFNVIHVRLLIEQLLVGYLGDNICLGNYLDL